MNAATFLVASRSVLDVWVPDVPHEFAVVVLMVSVLALLCWVEWSRTPEKEAPRPSRGVAPASTGASNHRAVRIPTYFGIDLAAQQETQDAPHYNTLDEIHDSDSAFTVIAGAGGIRKS